MGLSSPYASAGLAPPVGEVSVDGLEVTQAVQDLKHSVPLVADKPTIVRVYLSRPSGAATRARGELTVQRLPTAPARVVPSLNTVLVDPSQDDGATDGARLRAKREDIELSLNFRLPDDLIGAGEVSMRLNAVVEPETGRPVPILGRDDVVVAFRTAPPLRVNLVAIRYRMGNPPREHVPSARDYALIRSWLRRAYPTAELVMTQRVVDARDPPPFKAFQVNAQLTAIRNADVSAGTDPRTHYYGLVADGGFFMRGLAHVPASPNPSAVGSGPTGPGTFDWDFDGSYGDWYTGHELGHTFGRRHPGFCNGNSRDDLGYPFENGQLCNADGRFVGWDAGDASLGIPMAALPGTEWHDVMTYCSRQWLSSHTYENILKRLDAEDDLGAGPPPPGAGIAAESAAAEERLRVRSLTGGGFVSVVGEVDPDAAAGRFLYVFPVEAALASVPEAESRVAIRVRSETGSVIATHPASAKYEVCSDEEAPTVLVDTVIPGYPQAGSLELLVDGVVVDVHRAGERSGTPRALRSLQTGAEAVDVRWGAEADTGTTRFLLQVSDTGGESWQTVAVGLRSPEYRLRPEDFPDLHELRVRVLETDGFTSTLVSEDTVPLR